MDKRIEELLDKQALHENLMTYCRGIDRMDLELMKSTYWPDGTDDHGRFVGNAHEWCHVGLKSREVLVRPPSVEPPLCRPRSPILLTRTAQA